MELEIAFEETIETVGKVIESAGVVVIVVGALMATWSFLRDRRRDRAGERTHSRYRAYRRSLGRSILLGLEFLVAGDIIRTVVIEPTFTSVGVLGLIVLIRTFLSVELELEIDGRWPWQRRENET